MKQDRIKIQMLVLIIVSILLIGLYLSYQTYGNWEFALKLRGKKVLAFLLVALASSVSTISFQTLARNQFLTPGILGLDNLYVLIQTLLFYFVGGTSILSKDSTILFLVNLLLMTGFSVFFIQLFMNRTTGNLFLFLMVGMVAGTLFSSLSTFLQVLMDPNEYDLLQGKIFASFGNIETINIFWATFLILFAVSILSWLSSELDIMHLGRDYAIDLGVNVYRLQQSSLFAVALLTGSATALVGPTVFLGFIVSTITYRVFKTFRHRQLFLGGFLIAVILLVGGQFLVEQIFKWKTTISIVIQFVGGVFFLSKILAEGKNK